MNEFALSVGGKSYAGWTALSVTRAMDALAHTFGVSFTDKWTNQEETIPIRAGLECALKFGARTVVTGYIDEDSITYDGETRSLSFSGRSKTADLVDCMPARGAKKRWRKVGLRKIASDLCTPFGIDVSTEVSLGGTFRSFAVEEGETVFAALDRAARMRGVLITTNAEGNVVFDRTGTNKVTTRLVFGENILRGQSRRSWRDRFSDYTLVCQTSGDDNVYGKATSIRRTVSDPVIERHRPMTISADNEDSGRELNARANWEANVRAGRAHSIGYTIQGWEHADGLWEPNTLVRVVDTAIGIDDELLISSVTSTRNEQGTTTDLTVVAKEAFDVQPLPTKPKEDGALA